MPKVKVIESGFVAGKFHKAGEVLELTERQTACGLRRKRIEVPKMGDPGPVFIDGDPEEATPEGDQTEEAIKAELKEMGIKFRANASIATLKKKLAEAQESGLE